MSRRQHVVRSDDQSGVGNPRLLGGCTILCSVVEVGGGPTLMDASTFAVTDLTAPIEVSSSGDYQRCFVSATIGYISAWEPAPIPPPGPGSWNVRFEAPDTTTDTWTSVLYRSPCANTTLTQLQWERAPNRPEWEFVDWGSLYEPDDFYPFVYFRTVSGVEVLDPAVTFDSLALYFMVQWQMGPGWVELSLTAPTGEGQEDIVVTDGEFQ